MPDHLNLFSHPQLLHLGGHGLSGLFATSDAHVWVLRTTVPTGLEEDYLSPPERGRLAGLTGRQHARFAGGRATLRALLSYYILCRRRHSKYYADPFSMPIVDGEVLHLPRS